VTSIKKQLREHYESGALDEITVNRDSKLKVKELREMLLLGLEFRIVGPVTTSTMIGMSAGTILGSMLFGAEWQGLIFISFLGLSCWVDSLSL
jgi:hypothetical protein